MNVFGGAGGLLSVNIDAFTYASLSSLVSECH